MGEFGAVSVVSGHIRGETNTLPLHVEILYNEYAFAASFAVASVLTLLAFVTLALKTLVEWQQRRSAAEAAEADDTRKGSPHEHRGPQPEQGVRQLRRPRRREPRRARAASWWRCSVPRDRARPPCSASSPGWSRPIGGVIRFHGEDATEQPVRERQVGFVFQHYALFRHMSVFENIAFGLRVRPRAVRPPEAEIRDTVMDLLQPGAARRAGQAPPVGALRRPAPARGARPRARGQAQGAAARRAVRRARRQGAQGAAPLAPAAARGGARHQRLRHPRPGGGAGGLRPRGDHERGPGRAERHAGGGVRAPRHAVRLRLPGRREPVPRPDPSRAGEDRRRASWRRRPSGPTPATRTRSPTCAPTTSS